MMKFIGAVVFVLADLAGTPLQAGFRSPESLVRNVYGHYGQGSVGLSSGLSHDEETAHQFFDADLHADWTGAKKFPYDYFVQSTSWKLGPISYAITRKQFDKTYVAVAFSNQGRAVMLNFIVVNGPKGWVLADVQTSYDSLRSFLAQYRN